MLIKRVNHIYNKNVLTWRNWNYYFRQWPIYNGGRI